MSLIGEIHNEAYYSGSSLKKVNVDELIQTYSNYCSKINVVTEPSLGGNFDLLEYVKNKTDTNLSILHFKITDKIIEKSVNLGVNSIIVIYEYNKENIQNIITKCLEKNINPIIEIDNIEQAKEISDLKGIKTIGINTRTLSNLKEIDFEKIPDIVSFLKKRNSRIEIIGESGLDTNHQRIGFDDIDFWIVGSSILKSRVPEKSIDYFAQNSTNLPYIWLRPSAFYDEKYLEIREQLKKQGYDVKHTIPSDDFLKRFFHLKKELFFSNPQMGKNFLTAIEEATKSIEDDLGIDGGYNEIWFLGKEDNELSKSYNELLNIKKLFRKEEDVVLKTIKKFGQKIDVKRHSLHTPDYPDHNFDILKILDIKGERNNSYSEIKSNF